MDDMIIELSQARDVFIKLADVAIKQKRVEDAKKFEQHAISIERAIELLKQK